MQTPDSQKIVDRFFEALRTLKAQRVIRGVKTFTDLHGINRRNLSQLDKDRSRDIFQPAWLTYLVEDYGVSPLWLLTGRGEFYRHRPKTQPSAGSTAVPAHGNGG